jgi:hypothetical protein
MSSVDLHTHSGFQRMLPESFAVVCAPNSTPKQVFPLDSIYVYVPGADDLPHFISYGIFRLTDPPGLKTILDCVLTDAFHPHPELPIYTVSAPFFDREGICFFDDAQTGRRQGPRPNEGFAIRNCRPALSAKLLFLVDN